VISRSALDAVQQGGLRLLEYIVTQRNNDVKSGRVEAEGAGRGIVMKIRAKRGTGYCNERPNITIGITMLSACFVKRKGAYIYIVILK
jgi:hypothetical protein